MARMDRWSGRLSSPRSFWARSAAPPQPRPSAPRTPRSPATAGSRSAAGKDYNAQAYAVALQADRKIVSGGIAAVAGLNHFALTRHTPASGIDTGFGEQGKVITPIGNTGSAAITDLAVLPSGAILALGNARQENEPRIALARYTSTGALDASFGNGGKVVDELLADGAIATTMALAADGSILVTGQIREGATQKVFLRRFSANGTPELLRTYTVGETGCATAARIFVRPDASIVLIGGLCKSFVTNGRDVRPRRLRAQARRGRHPPRRVRRQRHGRLGDRRGGLPDRDRGQPGTVRAARRPRARPTSAPSCRRPRSPA